MFKKLIIAGLISLFLSPAYAGTITISTLSGDSGVSYNFLNDAFSTIKNTINGNLEDVNLAADTLTERIAADSFNSRVRDYEIVGDWTYTGMLPATSATLTSDISLGTSYVLGYRIVKDTTAHTYTASKDTWVYIDYNAAYQFQEVANGAAAPTDPANSLRLATVITSGTAITSVTDRRQLTPPNLRIYQDLKNGCTISRDTAAAATVIIGRGEIEFGSNAGKVRRNTGDIKLDFSTSGSRNHLDTGTLTAGEYYYIHALADDDNAVNFDTIASLSSADATDFTGERLIGWCYADTASSISADSYGAYKERGGDAPNIAGRGQTGINIDMPAYQARILRTVKFYSSGRPVRIDFVVSEQYASGLCFFTAEVSADGIQIPGSLVGNDVYDAASVNYKYSAGGSVIARIDRGTHNIDLTATNPQSANNADIVSYSIVVQEL